MLSEIRRQATEGLETTDMLGRLLSRKRKQRSQAGPSLSLHEQLAQQFPDSSDDERSLICDAQPWTMTSPERMLGLQRAIDYICQFRIPGDFVECGVWRGGSMRLAAKKLLQHSDSQRKIWLYDTFAGMTPPLSADVDYRGQTAEHLLRVDRPDDPQGVWCISDLEQVQSTVFGSGYPHSQFKFIVGDVCQTLKQTAPETIALLRLDTDFYESTRMELEVLYPRLTPGGILIIDDYGHWQGCRQAVDEYFSNQSSPVYLQRVDYTCRLAVKLGI